MTAWAAAELAVVPDVPNSIVYLNPLAAGAFVLIASGERVMWEMGYRTLATTTFFLIDGLTVTGAQVYGGFGTGVGAGFVWPHAIRFKVGLGIQNTGANSLFVTLSYR